MRRAAGLALAGLAALALGVAAAGSARAAPADSTAGDAAAAESLGVAPAAAPAESTGKAEPPAAAGGAQQAAPGGFFRSPTGIMLRSLAVPGWGQATNGSWIKAGVAVAAEGLLVASLVRDSRRLQELTPGTPEYENTYNRRQQDAWWLGAVVFLSMIDAYVDAHLKSGDVELGPEPGPDGLSLAARVRWR
jgi:hypothetical protein